MFNIFNQKPQFVTSISADNLPWRKEGVLIWIPSSEGNLKYAYGYDKHKETKEFLLLNNVPLLKVHANECPTCQQLLQAGYGLDKVDRKTVEEIQHCINCNELNKETILDKLNPILMLLERGLYLISYIKHYPTDGQGNCFWTVNNNAAVCNGLSQSWEAQEVPAFLIPTQANNKFNRERVDFYRQKIKNGERLCGITFYVEGYMSALLDGHHRAMACLFEQKPFDCLTISRVHGISVEQNFKKEVKAFWACGQCIDASILPAGVKSKLKDSFNNISKIDSAEVENYLSMISQEWKNIIADKDIVDAAETFPKTEDIVSISLAGELSDNDIENCLKGNEFNEENREKVEHILNALIALNDDRAYHIAMKVASDERWISLWERAFKYLSRFKNNEVEDFFVNFLINDEENRTHIKKIVDDYFRE